MHLTQQSPVNQASTSSPVKTNSKSQPSSQKKKIITNQNYTKVPANSDDDKEQEAGIHWDGTVDHVPSSEDLEDLNLPEINGSVLKTTFDKNRETLQKLTTQDSSCLTSLCFRMRTVLSYM